MAIPEAQLETWSHQGSVQQSAQTYQTIRNVLNDSSSPYYPKDFSIFLQGSYGNDTNVYADSDVDIVICHSGAFYTDLDQLESGAKDSYEKARSPASYGFDEFKAEVLAWLQKQFGSSVKPGEKAIFIKGSGNRRDADVLACSALRQYTSGSNGVDSNYHEGICFFLPDGTRIENFPKQHSDNCTSKHQATKQWFKPVVRMYKNMRNRMIDDGVIKAGLAPSYFIEGMLWNVPRENFGASYDSSFVNTFNWIVNADKTQLTTASGLHWLVRNGHRVCWSTANFDAYLEAAGKYWTDWGK